MAKQHATVHLPVPPPDVMPHVREVVDAHPTWRVHTNRATFMAVTEKGSAFALSPKVEISVDDDGDTGGALVSLSGTVLGFGPNERRLERFVADLEAGIRAMTAKP